VRRATVYDPNDITRTTLKETNLHNERDGALDSGVRRATAYDPNDITRTTLKETNLHNERDGALDSGVRRATAYDPNDITRTTLKETNIHNERDGALDSRVRRATAYDPNDIARTTVKETNLHNERDGAMGSVVRKNTVYDPNDMLRTTIKETNLHNQRTGHMSAQPSGTGSGAKASATVGVQDAVRTTHRQLLHREAQARNMASGDVHKGTVYDPNDVAKTTIKETALHEARKGNVDSTTERGTGYLTNPKTAPNTSRQFVSTVEYTGDADGPEVGGYQVSEMEAPATQKQHLSDMEYSGNAKAGDDKPMSYEDVYNATMNETKQLVAEGRQPTHTSAKRSTGADSVNLDSKFAISEDESTRDWSVTTGVVIPSDVRTRGVSTRDKHTIQDANDLEGDTIDPDLLNAFRDNPYTQPLDSSTL
jgi:hypothetical protein